MRILICVLAGVMSFSVAVRAAETVRIDAAPAGAGDVSLDSASIVFDTRDAAVVGVSANLLADDMRRVTGKRPAVATSPAAGHAAIILGTLGNSPTIDKLVADGKLDITGLKGQWESHVMQTVDDPMPGVRRALVIVGSDRRGTAYGAMDVSRAIGVSPWYWWADVPSQKHAHLRATPGRSFEPSPKVQYRGIFINDEDWGFRPWAKNFDPSGNIGPTTYAHVFELMLRLHLNFIWPAMHPGSAEFTTFPGNAACADQWAIVTGSSHCEPMLRNNVYWDKKLGPWRYDTNRQNILDYWKWSAENRGQYESVWTLGIRGIHDTPMGGPKSLTDRARMLEGIIHDQRALIDKDVTKNFGPPAECFVPYKEVLPVYDTGMTVPDDVTLIWPDDNFGYIRRLGMPAERQRSGGAGVYYHWSYLGSPRSYLWVETTAPGLIWEELHKAYANDAKKLWIVNVGDIKPGEVALDFYSKLAWNPEAMGPDAQRVFLDHFTAETFGVAGPKVAALLNDYYKLAARRKPEFMAGGYPQSTTGVDRTAAQALYQRLLDEETATAAAVPADRADAYFETVGYPARALAATGLMFSGPADAQLNWKNYLDDQTRHFNERIANGKWRGVIADEMRNLEWPVSVGGKSKPATPVAESRPRKIVDAATGAIVPGRNLTWTPVAGLGWSGQAITPLPSASPDASGSSSVSLAFDSFDHNSGDVKIYVLPTMRLTVGDHLRMNVSVDGQPPTLLDVPGGEAGSENDPARRDAVLSNRQTLTVSTKHMPAGHHMLKIDAVDAGVVIDQIGFPVPLAN